MYRDGDYYGRNVNLAARVVARAHGGEVLVTDTVRTRPAPLLAFEPIGEVQMKGFSEPTRLYAARLPADSANSAG